MMKYWTKQRGILKQWFITLYIVAQISLSLCGIFVTNVELPLL
jgi:hypothetical protein